MSFVRKHVVVIGGGFSGTMLAVQLLRHAPHLSIAVVDKGSMAGRGLAYGTDYDCHLLNVPAAEMSAFPDEPDHFLRWANENHEFSVSPQSFLPRRLYGRYLETLLEERRTACGANFEWICDEVLSLRPDENGFVIDRKAGPGKDGHRKDGPALLAHNVVLAPGNFPPGNLGIAGLTSHSLCYDRLAWSKTALNNLGGDENEDVLLIGSGLTGVDIAIALHARQFKGKIHLLSRHGLVPQSHGQCSPWPRFWNSRSPRTVRGLLRLIRNQAASAAEQGSGWRAVIDSLRPLIQEIWQSLPLPERHRFLRHARAYWEVHRHRIAPEIAKSFTNMIASGQVQIHAGRVIAYSEQACSERTCSEQEVRADVTFRERHTSKLKTLQVTRVINCSGPETNCRKIEGALLANLFEQGLVRQDALSLGLDADEHGALFEASGNASQRLFTLGPTRKGSLWETTAVPELRVQAADLAKHLLCTTLRQQAAAWQPETLAAK
jgi:uncharacterized NAD(P)/FAD-binding protein YdhS